MNTQEVLKVMDAHAEWVQSGGESGEKAIFSEDTTLEDVTLRGLDLTMVLFRGVTLMGCRFESCVLDSANFAFSRMQFSSFSSCSMQKASISYSNLATVFFENCNMSNATLKRSHMQGSSFIRCNLFGTRFDESRISECDFSQSSGALNPSDWMAENLERHEDGYIAYKTFEAVRLSNPNWKIEPGSVINEMVNAGITESCGCGINVSTLRWQEENQPIFHKKGPIWRCLIRWEWLPSVVIPWGTNGKFRCGRVELLDKFHSYYHKGNKK